MSKQEFLGRLNAAWTANPKLRFGQLLESACGVTGKGLTIFHASDDELAQALTDYNPVESKKFDWRDMVIQD